MHNVLEIAHKSCFIAIIVVALYGIYCVILLRQQIRRRQFRNEAALNDFMDQLRDHIRRGEWEEAEALCTAPQNWYVAVPFLAQAAIEKRHLSMPKIRQAIASRFGREVITSMEGLIASVNTVVKCEPMLGLLGTVLGMIGAFGTIALAENPSAQSLMADLSHAMNATAMGLVTSIPLLLISNYFAIRLRKLEDSTFEHVQEILDEMEMIMGRSRSSAGVAARAR